MNRKIIWLIFSCLLILSMVLVSCGTKTPSTTTTATTQTTQTSTTQATTPLTKPPTTTTTPPPKPPTTTTGKWWDKWGEPSYGGTITFRSALDVISFDTYYNYSTTNSLYTELLCQHNWMLPRNQTGYGGLAIPAEQRAPGLAESWETKDYQTFTFHIRKGVRWWDKPPTNGREFTADDVKYGYDREFGLGSGFTKMSPQGARLSQYATLQSVTVIDKYTVSFKFKTATFDNLEAALIDQMYYYQYFVPKEVIDKYGDTSDWRNVCTTAPFMLVDYVSGSSETCVRNPNYWGYDDHFPKNRLPYVDEIKALIIPDIATAIAGIRTGKLSILEQLTWDMKGNLEKTNPELQVVANQLFQGLGMELRVDKPPFSDIRVRKALQMAVDIPTMAKTYFGGSVNPTPLGLIGTALPGYYTPFEQWPQAVKDAYTYNPAGAKKLLAEAGYPSGFKTHVVTYPTYNIGMLEIAKAYLKEVGVDVEIKVMDNTALNALLNGKNNEAMFTTSSGACGLNYPISRCLTRRLSTHGSNFTFNKDSKFDDMFNKFTASFDMAERKKITKEADDYAIAQQWTVNLAPEGYSYTFFQPWLKGYSGEYLVINYGYYGARAWIDPKLKK